jgi:hypothetical protein
VVALVAEATALPTESRRSGAPNARPPAPLIAIDQGEDLFSAENGCRDKARDTSPAEVLDYGKR